MMQVPRSDFDFNTLQSFQLLNLLNTLYLKREKLFYFPKCQKLSVHCCMENSSVRVSCHENFHWGLPLPARALQSRAMEFPVKVLLRAAGRRIEINFGAAGVDTCRRRAHVWGRRPAPERMHSLRGAACARASDPLRFHFPPQLKVGASTHCTSEHRPRTHPTR